MIDQDKIKGALLGTAIGDALGMPVEGMSHQNVRTYYKGIKEYRDDAYHEDGLTAGQWTDDTQFTFALARAMTERPITDWPLLAERVADEYVDLREGARRWGPTSTAAIDRLAEGVPWSESGNDAQPTNGAAMRAAPLGAWWAVSEASKEEAFDLVQPILEITHRHPASVAAGFGQVFAVRQALRHTPATLEQAPFWTSLIEMTAWAEQRLRQVGRPHDTSTSDRLRALTDQLDEYPLDLQEYCGDTSARADESWPFAVAMFARNPGLQEATLLSAINVGGDADTVGAMVGALLGGLNGWSSFPDAWRQGLEAVDRLEAEADAFVEALSG
jgi:ADP-ribosylglycohydrolase